MEINAVQNIAYNQIAPDFSAPFAAMTSAVLADQVVSQFFDDRYEYLQLSETKPAKEWIQSYTDRDELIRLSELSKRPEFFDEKVSCAEILNTCDLVGWDTEHKKVYREKISKFHPDRYTSDADKVLALQAAELLNKANESIRRTGECRGQGDFGCELGEENVTIIKTLQTPNWLGKLEGLQPACTAQVQGGEPIPVSLEYCSS